MLPSFGLEAHPLPIGGFKFDLGRLEESLDLDRERGGYTAEGAEGAPSAPAGTLASLGGVAGGGNGGSPDPDLDRDRDRGKGKNG